MATVLCIDDDAGVLGMYRALLERRGFKVLTASDGPTGIATSRKHSVDVIVLDLNMTGMDGNGVAAILAKEQPTVPVVICTGSTDDLPDSLKWFADELVHKGDGSRALLAAIAKAIRYGTADRRSPIPMTLEQRNN